MLAVAEQPQQSTQPEAELENQALTLSDRARAIKIADAESYSRAASMLKDVAALRREIQQHHAPLKKKADEVHKAICLAEARLLEPVASAEKILKCGIGAWDLDQRRIADQKEREAREEAERRAMEAREEIIEACEAQGASVEEIEAVVNAPLIVSAPVIRHEAPKVAGVSTAKSYRAVVRDIKKLCRAVADGVVPYTLVDPNMSALNAMARAQKGIMSVPGVVVEETANVRAGR